MIQTCIFSGFPCSCNSMTITHFSMLPGRGKIYFERCTAVQYAVNNNKTAMTFHYTKDNRQAETCSLPPLFCRKEGLKYSVEMIFRNTHAGVRNTYCCVTADMCIRIIFNIFLVE